MNDWLEHRVRLDLAAFADPGTTIGVNEAGGWLQATWTHRGRTVTSNFQASPVASGSILVRGSGGATESYSSFLSGDRMADLRSIARNTTRAIRAVPGYVRPRVTVNDGVVRGNAEDELESLVREADSRTKLVFVTADAGVGKTTLLGEIVRRKATDYALGRTDALWLYVNAQGSRLARLDQALAAALDDVRAPFPYHAVAALVRADALVLVIDGFDELIGAPGSYDDAYSSLGSFLTALDGNGTIVATARSAYYEQEFLTRVGTVPGLSDEAWTLTRVELLEWNDDERLAFLSEYAKERIQDETERGAFPERVLQIFEQSGAGQLAAKPFFLARVAEFASEGRGLESGPSLLDRLVNTYLAREATGKLVKGPGQPVLTQTQLSSVYEEIANEMWRQETRELSGATFRELIEIMAQLFDLDDMGHAMVLDRLPNSAFVHPGGTPGSVAFQHEIFFSYFMASPILASLRSGDAFAIATALRKGRLPNEAGQIVGRAVARQGTSTILALMAKAPESISVGSEQIRQNAGTIAAGMLREGLAAKTVVQGLTFVDVDLSNVLAREVTFQQCTFRGVDMRGATFQDCTARSSAFESVLVDGESALDFHGTAVSDFFGLRFEDEDGRTQSVYAPADVQRILDGAQLPAAHEPFGSREVEPDVADLVGKVARLFERANVTSFDNELGQKRLLRDPNWARVYDALLNTGIIREELRAAGGNRTMFVRMTVRPADLMAGLSPEYDAEAQIQDFWTRLSRRA